MPVQKTVGIVAIACLAFAAHPGIGATLENFQVASWVAGAYDDNNSGQFSHCAVSTSYEDGGVLLFAVDRNLRWTMGMVNPLWKLELGSTYEVVYAIDGEHPATAPGIAIDDSQMVISLDGGSAQLNRIRYARRLTVFAANQVSNFALGETEAALSAALSCTRRHLALEEQADTASAPAASGRYGAGLPAAIPTTASRLEATTMLADLLSAARIPRFHFLEPEQVPSDLAGYDAVWIAPDIVGVGRIVASGPDVSPEKVERSTTAANARACGGTFIFGATPGTDEPSVVTRFFTECETGSDVSVANYLVLPRPLGGNYVLAVMSVGGARDAAAAAERSIYGVAASAWRP